MKIGKVHSLNQYDDNAILWLSVHDVDDSLKRLAKEIDGDNYSENCFGICVSYYNNGEIELLSNAFHEGEVYYIDNNGDKNWLEYYVPKDLYDEIAKVCRDALLQH